MLPAKRRERNKVRIKATEVAKIQTNSSDRYENFSHEGTYARTKEG
jgi:hypothetical protein